MRYSMIYGTITDYAPCIQENITPSQKIIADFLIFLIS